MTPAFSRVVSVVSGRSNQHAVSQHLSFLHEDRLTLWTKRAMEAPMARMMEEIAKRTIVFGNVTRKNYTPIGYAVI